MSLQQAAIRKFTNKKSILEYYGGLWQVDDELNRNYYFINIF